MVLIHIFWKINAKIQLFDKLTCCITENVFLKTIKILKTKGNMLKTQEITNLKIKIQRFENENLD